MTEKLKGDNT